MELSEQLMQKISIQNVLTQNSQLRPCPQVLRYYCVMFYILSKLLLYVAINVDPYYPYCLCKINKQGKL